jgi:hypothetical protein
LPEASLTARLWGGETLWVCKPCQNGGQQRNDLTVILKDSFNSTDLVADIAGDLEVRAVGEVVEEYLEKAIEDAEKAIVNLIVDA